MRLPALRRLFRARTAAVVAIAAGALIASTLPVTADVADDSPPLGAIRVESTATLQARGAAVTVSVLVVCPAGLNRVFLNTSVTQRVGGAIANGSGSLEFICSGTLQDFNITVTASNEPFRQGVAIASAQIFILERIADQREIEIVR
jgi:hypothetical protein